MIDGSDVALCSKSDLGKHLRSPELAQRCILAAKSGHEGWVVFIREGRGMLMTAESVMRVGKRIAAGDLPPDYASRVREREIREKARAERCRNNAD